MYVNGKPATAADLAPLALYNYGCFTSMVVTTVGVRGLSLHLERLRHDSAALFGTEVDTDTVRALVKQALHTCPTASPIVVRVTLFQRDLDMGHPTSTAAPDVLVTFRPAPSEPPPPLRVTVSAYERDEPSVKNVGLLGQLQRRRAAQTHGFDDVLFRDPSGHISEGATWNIAFVRDKDIVLPEADVLPGTAVRLLVSTLPDHGFTVRTAPVTTDELVTFDAAFATNAVIGVRPVATIDETNLSPTPEVAETLRTCWSAVPFEAL
ncbi:aminotransferase class IV [Streptomyces sp. NPDC056468]|uniref:aminotransferase class IV n=1 Tax=Streptomyces sp. NPDC056468 TaxID=3345830 RepID=UPI003679F604